MSAKVIDLDEYRRKKAAEKSGKSLRGLGLPDDFSPFVGPDDQPEDFGLTGLGIYLGGDSDEGSKKKFPQTHKGPQSED